MEDFKDWGTKKLKNTTIKFNCSLCGKETEKKAWTIKQNGYICQSCFQKQKASVLVECPFCKKQVSQSGLESHKRGCSLNPINIKKVIPLEELKLDEVKNWQKKFKAINEVSFTCKECKQPSTKTILSFIKNPTPLCSKCSRTLGGKLKNEKIVCKYCGKEFDRYHIQKHEKVCTSNPANVVSSFIKEESQIESLKNLPTSAKKKTRISFKCARCGKKSSLYIWDFLEKPFYCGVCKNQISDKEFKRKYVYQGHCFDSSWEMYFYIYHKDKGDDIQRVKECWDYEFNGEIHHYEPDFKIEDKYYEIKGPQFFKEDGTMQQPWDHSKDDLYEVKHQFMLSKGVIIIKDIKPYQDYVEEKYTKDFIHLFHKDLEFPYPTQMNGDYEMIRTFHKSLYDASLKGKLSPKKAWENKYLIEKSALNRLKYVHSCKPSDVLQGFNVAKIAPKVSLFRPSLAEKLIKEYLNEADIIVDPFSGFSGRMLGSFNCGKHYIGWDINEDHVRESNEIANYKKIEDMCDVKVQDLITCEEKDWSTLRDVCLFTCPPYGGKEHWNIDNDEIEKSCDEWIDLCLEKHKGCVKYLFVVDQTEKYKDKIVKVLHNRSHFGTNEEYVVLIEN